MLTRKFVDWKGKYDACDVLGCKIISLILASLKATISQTNETFLRIIFSLCAACVRAEYGNEKQL